MTDVVFVLAVLLPLGLALLIGVVMALMGIVGEFRAASLRPAVAHAPAAVGGGAVGGAG